MKMKHLGKCVTVSLRNVPLGTTCEYILHDGPHGGSETGDDEFNKGLAAGGHCKMRQT
jgi:hypothetical protein